MAYKLLKLQYNTLKQRIKMEDIVYENVNFFITVEKSEIPWLKIEAKGKYKELSDMPEDLRLELYKLSNTIEIEMRNYFNPDKMNIASFGNMYPQVHMHIMCRYETDSFFPNPMWGNKEREAILDYPSINLFTMNLKNKLDR
jgi:diadenosine tetraphosphate (Ap4A) HIT family hydrolase